MFEIKDIILIVLVIVVIYLIFKTRKLENFESNEQVMIRLINNKYTSDIDAIRNLALISRNMLNTKNELTIPANLVTPSGFINAGSGITSSGSISSSGAITSGTNITANGIITGDSNIVANGDIISTNGNMKCKNNIFIDNFGITKTNLKKIMSSRMSNAGFATYNGYVVCPLYEGSWNIADMINTTSGRYVFGSIDSWDFIYVNKGWRVTVYENIFEGDRAVLTNTTQNHPKALNLIDMNNKISSYTAEFMDTA